MTVNDFLALTNDAYRGTDDVPPVIATDDANYWLRTANRIRRNLYKDTTKQWASTYQVISLGTISASAAPSFALPANFLSAAEGCYVVDTTGSRHDFPIIKPQEQVSGKQSVFVAGANPQTLYFSAAISATEGYIGGTLYLPAYILPTDIVGVTGLETVVVDDPDWLAVATAAKLAFNDITYESKAPDLNNEANALYGFMFKNNRRGTAGNPRKSPISVTRIGQRHSSRYS